QMIEMWNLLLQEGALTDQFRARLGIDATEPIAVRFIRMSKGLQDGLDYPSKLSRAPAHIERLMADGTAQAQAFLAKVGAPEGAKAEAVVEHGEARPPRGWRRRRRRARRCGRYDPRGGRARGRVARAGGRGSCAGAAGGPRAAAGGGTAHRRGGDGR